jgi:transcriptional regulator with XRE-family HTH domain
MKTSIKLPNPKELRRKLGLNQQEFWGKIGVTQSGGSRYESGRSMPRPVQQLLRLVHVDSIDITSLARGDYEIINYLKNSRPALYKQLKAQATASTTPKRRGNGSAATMRG